jgi:hypothetical protein
MPRLCHRRKPAQRMRQIVRRKIVPRKAARRRRAAPKLPTGLLLRRRRTLCRTTGRKIMPVLKMPVQQTSRVPRPHVRRRRHEPKTRRERRLLVRRTLVLRTLARKTTHALRMPLRRPSRIPRRRLRPPPQHLRRSRQPSPRLSRLRRKKRRSTTSNGKSLIATTHWPAAAFSPGHFFCKPRVEGRSYRKNGISRAGSGLRTKVQLRAPPEIFSATIFYNRSRAGIVW